MLITTRQIPDVRILQLSGALTESAKMTLGMAIFESELARCPHVILDLSNVCSIDSAGISELFLCYCHLLKRGIRLSLVNPRLDVLEVFTRVSLPSPLPIYKSEEEALRMSCIAI